MIPLDISFRTRGQKVSNLGICSQCHQVGKLPVDTVVASPLLRQLESGWQINQGTMACPLLFGIVAVDLVQEDGRTAVLYAA